MNTQETNKEEGKVGVEIYSTPTCHFCHLAKDWFTAKNINYVDFDVSKDAEKRKEMVEMTGQLGVPFQVSSRSRVA